MYGIIFKTILCLINLARIISSPTPNVKVSEVRQIVIDTCKHNPDSYYELDLEQFVTKDWIIKRYLKDNSNNVNEAAQSIIDTLHFYKDEKLQEITEEYFPAEFYATGFLIEHGVSWKNEPVSGFSIRCLMPFGDISDEMYELGRKFLLFFLYKHRMELDPGGRVFFVALDGIKFVNLDIKFLGNVVNYMNNYIPQQPGTYLVMDLNWVFKLTFQILINFVTYSVRKNIHFSTMKNINQWVNPNVIPAYVGGKLPNYKRIPDGVQSGKCLPHLKHIPKGQWDTFRKNNINCIREGMTENNVNSMNQYLRYC